jgi:hypothetical protein
MGTAVGVRAAVAASEALVGREARRRTPADARRVRGAVGVHFTCVVGARGVADRGRPFEAPAVHACGALRVDRTHADAILAAVRARADGRLAPTRRRARLGRGSMREGDRAVAGLASIREARLFEHAPRYLALPLSEVAYGQDAPGRNAPIGAHRRQARARVPIVRRTVLLGSSLRLDARVVPTAIPMRLSAGVSSGGVARRAATCGDGQEYREGEAEEMHRRCATE